MPSVSISAGLVAAPRINCHHEEAHQYVDALLDWKILLDAPWLDIYMSERTSEELFKYELYPSHRHLNDLFKENGIVEYSANDVVTIVNRLLQLTPSFETYFSIQDVLFDVTDFDAKPDIFDESGYKCLESELARCVLLVAILRRHCSEQVLDHPIILRYASEHVVRVRATVHDIDHTREDLDSLLTSPETFEGEVLVCENFQGLLDCLDESALLLASEDGIGLETAIRIALFKSRSISSSDNEWFDTECFAIGTSFQKILQDCCRDADPSLPERVLRAVVESIDGRNMHATHRLRTSAGGSAPQQTRGYDKAWRRDIDKEYHLHYWQLVDGTVELASIGPHNDFLIPT